MPDILYTEDRGVLAPLPHHSRLRAALAMARATKGLHEKVSFTAFLYRFAQAELRKRGAGAVDLDIDGLHLRVKVRGGEVSEVFPAVFLNRVYERAPGFAAGRGDVVIDGGANIGLYALSQARRGADVFCFEPDPDTFARLEHNIAANNLPGRVQAFRRGIGEYSTTARLTRKENMSVGSTLRADETGDVVLSSIPDILTELGIERAAILKLDIEGWEADALRGAAPVLDRIDRVVLEYHSPDLLCDVTETMYGAGFQPILVDAEIAYFVPADVVRSSWQR